LKQQGAGAGETSRTTNYELHVTLRVTWKEIAKLQNILLSLYQI
jgi:hypothetical protein